MKRNSVVYYYKDIKHEIKLDYRYKLDKQLNDLMNDCEELDRHWHHFPYLGITMNETKEKLGKKLIKLIKELENRINHFPRPKPPLNQ